MDMAQDTGADTTGGNDNIIPQPPPKPDMMAEGVNNLVNAISSVFAGMATESLAPDGRINVSQLPALLERTASMLRDISQAQDSQIVVDNVGAVAQVEAKTESSVLFEDEWKLAISKSTGKILGIFPDNALAQRIYSDEAEEEIASKNALSSYDSAVKRCRKQVEEIIRECRRTNRKFRDHDFDLGDENMCLLPLDNKYDYGILPQGYAQSRKIFKKPQFYVDGATANDVKQGQASDCWFLAGIAALTNFKACLTQNYVKVEGDEKVGVYGFVFHRDGEWIYEIVDDFLYTKNPRYGHLNKLNSTNTLPWNMLASMSEEKYSATFSEGGSALYFAQSRDENETWLPLLEKAFAKAHGDYWAIGGGHTGEAIEDLTGGITTEIRTEDILDPDEFWQEVMLCNVQFIFGCWTPVWPDGTDRSEGLVPGHAYSIMKAVEVEIGGETKRLVLVRNPWGNSEWTGRYSDGSKEMTVALLTHLKHETGDDGMFYMAFEDFLRKFEFIDRIRLIGNDWSCAQCWTNLKVPRTNHFLDTKYVFTMDRADYVVMSLSQLDDRYIRGLVGQYNFSLEFRLEKDGAENAGQVLAESSHGINTERSVNAEIHLEAGKYNVLLKVKADHVDNRMTVKDTVKHYVSTAKKEKLIQLAKKYNFAHMKRGVGDKEDRIFESLTVQEADKPEDEKLKSDSDKNTPAEDCPPPVGEDDGPDPVPEPPVDHPVAESLKPAPGKVTNLEEKKDRSIENWSPIATIGLRLFTRKARVALSVVQGVADASKLTESTLKDGKTTVVPLAEPTILVSGESKRIGNVPSIGVPLPLTPIFKPTDTGAAETISPIGAEDTSKAFVIYDSNGLLKLSSASSVPVVMSNSGVSEGAEKAESTKSAAEQDVELKNKTVTDKPPHFMKVHIDFIIPETLDEFKLSWEWAPQPNYIYIHGYLHEDERERLFDHTRQFLKTRQSSIAQPANELSSLPSQRGSLLSPFPNLSSTKHTESTLEPASNTNKTLTESQPTPVSDTPEIPPKPTPSSDNDKTDSSPQPDTIKTPPSSGNNSLLEGESPKGTRVSIIPIPDLAATASHETIPTPSEEPVNEPTTPTTKNNESTPTTVLQLVESPVSTTAEERKASVQNL